MTEVMSHYSVVKETDCLHVLEMPFRNHEKVMGKQCFSSCPSSTLSFCHTELWMGWTPEVFRLGEKLMKAHFNLLHKIVVERKHKVEMKVNYMWTLQCWTTAPHAAGNILQHVLLSRGWHRTYHLSSIRCMHLAVVFSPCINNCFLPTNHFYDFSEPSQIS